MKKEVSSAYGVHGHYVFASNGKMKLQIPPSDSEAQELEIVPLAGMISLKPFGQTGICERASEFKGREGPRK